jgi:hypothetical protein
MLNQKVIQQVTDLMIQALSDESIDLASPMSDAEIKLLSAVIDQTIVNEVLDQEMTLICGPREIIATIDQGELSPPAEIHARKTLRRFYELLINLTGESETRTIN